MKPREEQFVAITPGLDPALVGRELGHWHMVSAWLSVPMAIGIGALLLWYFVRLGRPSVPRGRRRLRRASIGFALVGLIPLLCGITFVHPHEQRFAWAASWALALLALLGWFSIALVDFLLVARSGLREYDELRRKAIGVDPDQKRAFKKGVGAHDA